MKYLTQNKVKIKLKLFLRAGTHCHLVEAVLGGCADAARLMPCDESHISLHHLGLVTPKTPTHIIFLCTQKSKLLYLWKR